MPKMNIQRSTEIDVPVERIHNHLVDMSSWPAWSPWLIAEPEATVIVSDDKRHYSWEGNRVGAGEMIVRSEVRGEKIDYDLTFLKPWKSEAKVSFLLDKIDDAKTKVTWTMDSSLPFFLFWMKSKTEKFIGMDYDRGLSMLKEQLETGKIASKVIIHGESNYPGCNYLGIERKVKMSEASKSIEKDFEVLMTYAHQTDACRPEGAFDQMKKWDIGSEEVHYIVGVPYEGDVSDRPSGTRLGSIPATRVWKIEHRGRYEHLGNAWSAGHMAVRNKEFKVNKSIAAFETYGNSPKETAPEDLISYLHFPMK